MAAPMATTSSGLTPLCGLLAEQLLDRFLHLGHARQCRRPRMTSSILAGADAGILESPASPGRPSFWIQLVNQRFKLGAGDL